MYMGTGTGIGLLGTVSLVLVFVIKVLIALFIAGLILGLFLVVKRHVFAPGDFAKMRSSIWRQKQAPPSVICTACGKELNAEWKVCPHCGTENITLNA